MNVKGHLFTMFSSIIHRSQTVGTTTCPSAEEKQNVFLSRTERDSAVTRHEAGTQAATRVSSESTRLREVSCIAYEMPWTGQTQKHSADQWPPGTGRIGGDCSWALGFPWE